MEVVNHIFAEQTALIMDLTEHGFVNQDEFVNGKPDLELTEWFSISLKLADGLSACGAYILQNFYGCWLGVPDEHHEKGVEAFVTDLLSNSE
ncbi:hypothetical protein LH51_08640 [Nitrincola sp. A-D6]|uniref:hypothetical protein n=1 Tax=Nitrincola sp. A-D6 TaxID=1545442 RepID=UPI00051FE93A|nr:hypothetical protein [Nitrincola sp. A-D6]KGK42289.1 hypothetical protein LH51_08640 [Nitrincola sp. A-D6]